MDSISYSVARKNFAETMQKVCDNHDPIIITRKKNTSVVMLSIEDYEALNETAYLLKSPKNARRLSDSIAQLSSGCGLEKKIDL